VLISIGAELNIWFKAVRRPHKRISNKECSFTFLHRF
jgi:hypothetical protein